MQKTGLAIFMLVIVLLTAAACGSAASETKNKITTVATTSRTTPAAKPTGIQKGTAASTKAIQPTTGETQGPNHHLMQILGTIIAIQDEAAGSGSKRKTVSGELLDWVEASTNSQTDHEIQVRYLLEFVGDESTIDQFFQHFEEVRTIIQSVLDGDTTTRNSMESAGYTLRFDTYTQVKWDAFDRAVKKVEASH